MADMEKKTHPMLKTIAGMRKDVQTAIETTLHVYKTEKEILQVKHAKNVSFSKAGKIVESYMKTQTYVPPCRCRL